MAGKKTLRSHVRNTIRRYLTDMGTTEPDNLYRTLLSEIEPPLLEETLRHTNGNQTRAARILGITRNTLRSKLRQHGLG